MAYCVLLRVGVCIFFFSFCNLTCAAVVASTGVFGFISLYLEMAGSVVVTV